MFLGSEKEGILMCKGLGAGTENGALWGGETAMG